MTKNKELLNVMFVFIILLIVACEGLNNEINIIDFSYLFIVVSYFLKYLLIRKGE